MSKLNNWYIEYSDLSNTIREPIIDDSVDNGGGYSSDYTESYNENNEFDDVYGEEELTYE